LNQEDTEARERALMCVNALLQKKARDLTILRVKEVCSFTDYFVICSGGSDRQVQALADAIREDMKSAGILPLGVEGEKIGKWILLDYADVVVHVFYEPVREFYNLEQLWPDVPRMDVDVNLSELATLDPGM
jgi:ribosome-associated protein